MSSESCLLQMPKRNLVIPLFVLVAGARKFLGRGAFGKYSKAIRCRVLRGWARCLGLFSAKWPS